MATKLVAQFKDGDSKTIQWSFNYTDPDVATSAVSTLMSTMITNGNIYANPPLSVVGAKLVTTTETILDLNG